MEEVCRSDHNNHDLIKKEDEVHQLHVLLVDIVVPDRSDGDEVVAKSEEEIEDKEEVETLVFESDAVVHPGRVVVDLEDTSVAH